MSWTAREAAGFPARCRSPEVLVISDRDKHLSADHYSNEYRNSWWILKFLQQQQIHFAWVISIPHNTLQPIYNHTINSCEHMDSSTLFMLARVQIRTRPYYLRLHTGKDLKHFALFKHAYFFYWKQAMNLLNSVFQNWKIWCNSS